MKRPAARAAAVLAALAAQLAGADPFHSYGFGPRAAAMAGALTAEVNDYTAVFYNPAQLVTRKEINFGFGFQFYKAVAQVQQKELARDLDCSACQPPDAVGYSLGLLFPLPGKVKNRVALGLGLYIPSGKVLRLLSTDPQRPFWYNQNSHNDRLALYLALGIRLTDWLRIGLGAQVLADLLGTGAEVKVDLFSKQVSARQLDSNLSARVAPVFAIALQPIPRLRLGATFRWEMSLRYEIPASVNLSDVGTLGFVISGTTHYTPHTLAFGAAFDVLENLTVTLDGDFRLYSAAPSPYMSLAIDLSGAVIDGLGLGKALDVASAAQAPGFTNTFGGRLGIEWRALPRFTLRGGAFYLPTPVPLQNAPGTNILDGTAVGATFGVSTNFADPLEIFAAPIHIDLALQAQFLLPREAIKELADPVPSYTYSARTLGGSIALRYDF